MKKILFLLISIILAISILVSFGVGQYPITLNEYIDVIYYWLGLEQSPEIYKKSESINMILQEIRLPRILAAILVGASLSISGAVFQGMFVNPLVSPSILGVLSGASFGAALGMLLGESLLFIQFTAFLFGFIAVFLAMMIGKTYGGGNSLLMLVLGGIISSSLFSAFLSLIKYMADPYNTLPSIVYWLMGSLSSVTLESVGLIFPWVLISTFLLILFGKHLNLMSLGEDEALSLGVDVKKVRFIMIILATLLSTLSVMLAGIIGWVGLVIPHIARFIIGSNHITLIPFCAILGATFLVIVDTISRTISQTEIPLGIITSLVGIPVFIFVLRYNLKRNEG
ncbi:iron ABC transporter permease [Poseidonibacter lekithochrous]|uniref:FecCD family ABC transporter permease n=1 Tax=Poseidonibacter TaxID=2321187 RepID=UPI001C095EC9|nr:MULTISPECIES: iron ABC transporter permease [Poseidonibacter]MBU3013337.1 iron ABC transporter permease [Poseidonibacter lekithochrous]MDO6826634.1 iron ABC transporter permease [Poseidonibacter sp. 1_MG-2023]